MSYQVFEISTNGSDTIEQLGTKEKFWFYDKNDKTKKLFKIGRPGTGENWAEKVTGELAKLLDLPCAEYEFARWNGKEGVISPLFVPQDGRLVHGNELLAKIIKNYPKKEFHKVREYKLSTVLAVIKAAVPYLPIGYERGKIIQKPLELFVGYLMLDCWISNPDRHHENWGLVLDSKSNIHLAPTYDHASGLGCRVSDDERNKRLNTKDTRYNVEAFVGKAKSAFYDENLTQMETIKAFINAAKQNRKSANFWLDKLESISPKEIENIFGKVPNELMSKSAINFALAILAANKKRLLESKTGL